MLPLRVRRYLVRAVTSDNWAVRPSAMLLAICCCLTVTGAQWLETTIVLPDSLGPFDFSGWQVWDSADNKLFLGGDSGVLIVDGTTRERLAVVPVGATVRALCLNPVASKVYCAMSSDQVAVIDGATGRLLTKVTVGARPVALCYNSQNDKIYSANHDSDNISVIDCGSDTIVATISGVERPSLLCYGSGSNKVYSDRGSPNAVVIIDGAGDSIVAELPAALSVLGLGYDPQDDKVYAAGFSYDSVAVIDGAADTIRAFIPVADEPFAFCYDSRDNKMYCANWYGPWFLTAIDCTADTVLAAIQAGPPWGAPGLCYNSIDNKLYCEREASDPPTVEVIDCTSDSVVREVIADCEVMSYNSTDDLVYGTSNDGIVAVVDGASDRVVGAVASRDLPYAFCYVPQHNKVYCACYYSHAVVVIDAMTNTLLNRITTGLGTRNLCYNPIGDKVYCINELSSTVTVIDAAADTVVATIEGAGAGNPLCYNSHDDKVYCAGHGYNTHVIDGVSDSIVASIPVVGGLLYNPRDNKVYCAKYPYDSVAVISGSTDSIIATIGLGRVGMMCYNPVTGNVYCGRPRDSSVAVIDGAGDSLLAIIAVGRSPGVLCYDSRDNRIYCTFSGFPDGESLAAIDCAENRVVARLRLPSGFVGTRNLCYAPASNHVFFTNVSDTVAVIDGETSTIIGEVPVGMHAESMVWDSTQGRLYVANQGSYISVLGDTGAGIEESFRPQPAGSGPAPSVVYGVLFLPQNMTETGSAVSDRVLRPVLLDISGRKVLDLRPGANDVRTLAPGVYFVSEPRTKNQELRTTTKVVIAR